MRTTWKILHTTDKFQPVNIYNFDIISIISLHGYSNDSFTSVCRYFEMGSNCGSFQMVINCQPSYEADTCIASIHIMHNENKKFRKNNWNKNNINVKIWMCDKRTQYKYIYIHCNYKHIHSNWFNILLLRIHSWCLHTFIRKHFPLYKLFTSFCLFFENSKIFVLDLEIPNCKYKRSKKEILHSKCMKLHCSTLEKIRIIDC